MNGMKGVIEEDPGDGLPSPRLRTLGEKTAVCEPGGGFSPGMRSAGTSVWDFPASTTEKFLSCVTPLSTVLSQSSVRRPRQVHQRVQWYVIWSSILMILWWSSGTYPIK